MISISNALAYGSARLATAVLPAVDNPFDHTSPSLEIFGVTFSSKVYAVLGGIWGLSVVYAAYKLVMSFVKFAGAKKVEHNPDALSDATRHFKIAAIALVGVVAVGPIFAAIAGLAS